MGQQSKGREGNLLWEGQRITLRGSRERREQGGSEPTQIRPQSSTGNPKRAKMGYIYTRGVAAVEKLWSGKANRDGHACLVGRGRRGQRGSPGKKPFSRAE